MDLMGLSHGRMTGGFKHLDYDFPFHIWDGIILPIGELHHFSDGLKPPTRLFHHGYKLFKLGI
jgi:hypothetical protein